MIYDLAIDMANIIEELNHSEDSTSKSKADVAFDTVPNTSISIFPK